MTFIRAITEQLEHWKNETTRLPLILKGARQVGKTSSIREFGKSFIAIHEFNFQKDLNLKNIFKETNNPKKILDSI